MRIQHNLLASNAYSNYARNTKELRKNLERLSSGYKLNRAGDDAAGLAISEKMRAQITGQETAQNNAADGISLVKTAEGALTEVHDMLNRMIELATQSANGTYSNDTDRVQLQKEMDQLLGELDRIADSANFNGIPLLDGSMDAGGDVVYTKGAFQFAAAHPAGTGNNALLPPVGSGGSVLHTDGAIGGSINSFSIDLENLKVNKDGSIDITVGDNLTITIMNETGGEITSDDIVKAIETKLDKGSNDGGIRVFFDGAKIAVDSEGSRTLEIGDSGARFRLDADGSRLTFTQVSDGAGIDMPQRVDITSSNISDLKVEDSSSITPEEPVSGEPAKYKIDLRDVDMTAPGNVTVSIFGKEFDLKITGEEFKNKNNVSIGELLAAKLTDALKKAGLAPDNNAGALTFKNNGDGTITLEFENKDREPSDYKDKLNSNSISVTTAAFQDGSTVTTEVDLNVGTPGSSVLEESSASVTIDKETYNFKIVMWFDADKVDPDADDVIIISEEDAKNQRTMDVIQAEVIEKLNKILEKRNEQNRAGNSNYNAYVNTTVVRDGKTGDYKVQYEYVEKRYIGIDDDTGGSGSGGSGGGGSGDVGDVGTGESFSGDWNPSTTVLQSKSDSSQERLASTVLDLKALTDANGRIPEGSSITIGRDIYTFTYDKSKIGEDGYVVLNGGEKPDELKTAAEKLTAAAKNNSTYTVGHDRDGRITLLEKKDQRNFDLTTMDGIEKSLGFKAAVTRAADGSKGLTLQIGDTAESYNQLKVNIRDCHVKALGIDRINIANQADAAGAVDAINDAISYISDVRGTLGATQNRLDHTISNLGVMTENIQDAESTIRDADIAEEMVSYTRNNILIQSAQAMLSQANQVPQGVLQLLR